MSDFTWPFAAPNLFAYANWCKWPKCASGKLLKWHCFPPPSSPSQYRQYAPKSILKQINMNAIANANARSQKNGKNVNATSTRNGKTTAPHRNSNFAYVFPLQLHYWCLRIVRAHFFFCSLISLWHRFIWRYALWRNCGTSTTIFSLLKLNVYPDCTNNLLHTQLR